MQVSFILSLIIMMLTIMYLLWKRNSLKTNIIIAFITCILCITILIFPLLDYENVYLKGLASFIYAIKCIGLGQDLEVLAKIDLNTIFGYMPFFFLIILFLATPALTVSFIMAYLERIIQHLRFTLARNRHLYVFSELNDKALLIAKDLVKQKKSTVIFTNVTNKKELSIKAITLNEKIENLNFHPKSTITFYMLSQNEEENLNATLALIDKYKNYDHIKIYVANKKQETPLILDSMDKGNITVEILNETERAVFNLLNNKPLFLNTVDKTISILIVGCGHLGKEFLRDALWCGTLPDYKLKFLIIDLIADSIQESIKVEMPEVLNNYDITFLNTNIKSLKALEVLRKSNDINYILVSMDNDDKNIDGAIMLRQFFLREFNREPIINVYIENTYKSIEILGLSNEKNDSYNINTFGSIHELYQQNSIVDSELEKLAIAVNLAYNPLDKDLKNYNLREYNKRSSRASALHIKYKLYAALSDKYKNVLKDDLREFRRIYSPRIEELLTRCEHERWLAYTRSIGYVKAEIDDVMSYYPKKKQFVDYLAKRHPALVSFDELPSVSETLSKISGQKLDYQASDRKIIKYIHEDIDV